MAKIHWIVYIVVGSLVSIFSYKLDYQKLVFFFYTGLVFVVVGVIKLIFNSVKNKTNKTQKINNKLQHKSSNQPHQARHFKYCSKCHNIVRLADRFCNKCGARF